MLATRSFFKTGTESRLPTPISITNLQLARADLRDDLLAAELAKRGKTSLDNSIEDGRGTIVGFIGEEVKHDNYLSVNGRPAWRRVEQLGAAKYHCDLILQARLSLRAEVKSKKQTYDGMPESHYWATVCAHNISQQCDIYVFSRVHVGGEKCWFLGCMPRKLFFKEGMAQFFYKGEQDPMSPPHIGWRFKENCWNVPVGALWKPRTCEELCDMWERYIAVDGFESDGL